MAHHTNNTALWARVGAIRGLIAAGILSLIYLSLPLLLGLFFAAVAAFVKSSEPSTTGSFTIPEMFGGTLFISVIYVVIGVAIGVMPALLVGALSGGVIGAVLSWRTVAAHRWNRFFVGLKIAIVGVGLLSAALAPHLTEGNDATIYFFFIGIPSVPYLFTCIYLSLRLPHWVAQEQSIIEVPIGETPYLPT